MNRPTETNEHFPDIVFAFFIVMILLAIHMLLNAVVFDLGTNFQVRTSGLYTISFLLATGIVISGLMTYKKLNYHTVLFPSGDVQGKMLLAATPPILLLMLSSSIWEGKLTSLLFSFNGDDLAHDGKKYYSWYIALDLISACIVAPITEELLFRGLILRSFLKQYSVPKAIIWSSLLFALMHMNIYQFAHTFTGGCLLAWIYIRTRSLLACILAHALYNFIVSINYYFDIINYAELFGSLMTALSFAVSILSLVWLHRIMQRYEN